MNSNYEKCFDKHSFQDLTNGDLGYFYRFLEFYSKLFPYGQYGVYVDIGCNAGAFINVLQYIGITENIHCFEPHPVISKKTKEVYSHIIMNDVCVGNKNEMVEIYIPTLSVGLSSIICRPVFSELEQDINILQVKCVTLDDYCLEHNIPEINFLKIDVEGFEKKVFEGARNLLMNHKIKCGVFEIGNTLKDAGTSENEICEMLEQYGYTIVKDISPSDYLFYVL